MTPGLTVDKRPSFRRFLFEALNEILETLAYTVACEELPESALDDCQAITAEIGFQGEREGSIAVTASQTVALRLAMSLSGLGREELLAQPALLEDAMRESANMAAGVFLRRMAGDGGEYRLGLPHIARGPRAREERREQVAIVVTLDTVEGPVGAELELRIHGGAGQGGGAA